jgi:hypothetical protein
MCCKKHGIKGFFWGFFAGIIGDKNSEEKRENIQATSENAQATNENKSYAKIISISFLFFILTISMLNKDCIKYLFTVICCLGVFYFFLKTMILIFYSTIKNKDCKYELPVAAYTYMLASIYFIAIFIYNLFNNKYFPYNYFNKDSPCLENFQIMTTFLVITAFIWNFSKSFFTINALEYGWVSGEEIKLNDGKKFHEVGSSGIVGEMIIRLIVAVCFIYIENYLTDIFNIESLIFKIESLQNIESLVFKIESLQNLQNNIRKFAICSLVLYIFLMIWYLFFLYVFKKNREFNENWIMQFSSGLTLCIFLLCFGIKNEITLFGIETNNVNKVLVCLIYIIPSILLCYFIIRIEINEFESPEIRKMLTKEK